MKNLTVHCQRIYNLNETKYNCPEIKNILQSNIVCCINPDNDNIYILKSNHLYVIAFTDDIEILDGKINISNVENVDPIGIEYWSDENILYCAYKSGDLIKITAQLPFDQEVVAHIDDGLKCMKLSPDQEILILITNNDTVMTMMSNLQVISQASLTSTNFGEKQFITAGWGHKETQFHGSEGKAAAKIKSTIIGKTENDNGLSSITWRGDGSMFAVSFFNKSNNIRQFKVFNREGVLQYTSELTDGLEENISWKPSGNLIATTQRLPNKHVITLFEKNGLKHRDFSLPFHVNEVEVMNLMWSPDSDVLAVWCRKTNSKHTFLQLYTENNYHWYLKETIKFTAENPLIYHAWSTKPRNKKCLIALTAEKIIVSSFIWTVNHTRGKYIDDKSVVGVVNGNKILLTAFKVGIVPPPMCHQSLDINQNINACFFAPCDSNETWFDSNFFFCLLESNQLAFFAHTNIGILNYKHVKSYDIEWDIPLKVIDDNFPNSLNHFLWLKKNVILFSAASDTHSYLCIINLENFNEDNNRIIVRDALTVDGHIHHIVNSPDIDIAYLIIDNHVLKYTHDEGIMPTEINIPECCEQVEVIEIEKRHVIVTLDSANRFYINGKLAANNITSFCIHSHFLLLTTLQHALLSVSLNKNGFDQLSMFNHSAELWTNNYMVEGGPSGLSIRRLERGSSLVTVISNDSKCVLQMPRGNLETIQPRALSFVILKSHLNALNYFTAFDIMRKQRINLNLIYDHNPNLFIDNAEKFIDDIKNPCWLNLFISELQEEDVSETIYKTCYSEQENEIRQNCEVLENGKVEFICELLRKIMETKSTMRNLIQPILTCLVKNKNISGLEAALRKISEFKMKEGTSDSHGQSAEEALKYLLYLVDVNMLYDIALGMYDLELTKFIASKSLKDPKEYIPYLNNLAEYEENYRKFMIDKDLKRYESALNHIAKRPDRFNECIEIICQHNLYTKAIKLFSHDTNEYVEIARIFGEFLTKNRKYREAGLMFERSKDLDRALEVYKKSGSWQDAIIISTKMNMQLVELIELYRDLVTRMRDDRRYRDAAEISSIYLEQLEDSISILCEGKEWREALRIAHTSKRLDLIETNIKPGVHEHAIDIYLRINKNKEEFLKHRKRLVIVRKEKEKKQAINTFSEIDDNTGRELSDLLSDTSSVIGSTTSISSSSSRNSGRSYRSSKNRRKQERKVLSIKEGSAFEDLAIIRALHVIITNTYAQREEACNVNRLLVNFCFDELAEKIQNALIEILGMIEKYKYEIWPKVLDNELNDNNIENHTPNSLLEPKFKYPPQADTNNFILDLFPQSTQYC